MGADSPKSETGQEQTDCLQQENVQCGQRSETVRLGTSDDLY